MTSLQYLLQFAAALLMLTAFVFAGAGTSQLLHLPIPGVVFGLAWLTLVLAVLRHWRPSIGTHAVTMLSPASRPLLRHLGLLFVPAEAGVITQWPLLRAEWAPAMAGLFGSTLIGLAATGWVTQRLWPKERQGSE